MKDIDFLETVFPKLRNEFEKSSIENKILHIVLLPLIVVSYSEEPRKVKFFLFIITLIIFPVYIGFLIITLPFLLLASLVLELHFLKLRTVLSYFPKLLLIIFIMFVISGFGLGYSLVTVSSDFDELPLDVDNGSWNRTSELFKSVHDRFLVTQVVTSLAMIGFYILAFYFVFLHKKEHPYLLEEEKENLIMFFRKSFFYIPIYLTYLIIPATAIHIDLGGERTTLFYNYYTELFAWIWLEFGFAVFYGIFLLIRLRIYLRKRGEKEGLALEDDPKETDNYSEEGEQEVEERAQEEEELGFSDEVEQKAEELVKDEMNEKFEEEVEKKAEELVEEQMKKEENDSSVTNEDEN
ncbi:MAG: hypothetical protein HeimC3_48270 [Candidatus Heimdallarchaeota archaeon LC_3]|nr:MAG: hypothetical protein HeimC3_48270 [Candidatus Heimdallarchaeota archaeon LC_3]